MGIAIQELRPDGVLAAVQFAGECGCETKTGKLLPGLSLVALDGDTTVAAALCYAQPGKRHRVEVALRDATDDKLHRSLLDKTLMKLNARDVRKFDVRTNGSGEPHDFWRSVSWIDQALIEESASPETPPEDAPSADTPKAA